MPEEVCELVGELTIGCKLVRELGSCSGFVHLGRLDAVAHAMYGRCCGKAVRCDAQDDNLPTSQVAKWRSGTHKPPP